MGKKRLTILLLVVLSVIITGCGKKDATADQNIKQLLLGYQQTVVTFFELKSLQEDSMLSITINDMMLKMEDSHKKLEKISGIIDNIEDQKIKSELITLVELNQQREKLIINYLNDIRRDLDYQLKNPELVVDINGYIVDIPTTLMELEYQSEQSAKRLEALQSN
ncbi:MAG: hypothetical protein HGA27_08740 [Peptococcaceae bacterium]|nr:hypothetical protein [Peptococcaceae bacterium]